ncbi:MAG TPA: hypothetical protein VJ932_10285, partial [Alkalispirochaeta sp.]|nr:hypothetical protein [Alkalispirochaeta sp.]
MTTGAAATRYRSGRSWCILAAVLLMNSLVRVLSATAISLVLALLVGDASSSWDGAYRDALSGFWDPLPVAEELLVIPGRIPLRPERERDIAPGELLWTLAELRVEQVLLPESWIDADLSAVAASRSHVAGMSRISAEFSRIDQNIVELFDAIRMGSIAPGAADRFVAHLRQLVAESEERVQDEYMVGAGTSRTSVAEVMQTLGPDRVAGQLSQLGIALPSYSAEEGFAVPLGSFTEDLPVRRLPFSLLRRYVAESERFMRRMVALEETGFFEGEDPRDQPSIMLDHLASLRMDLYEHPTESRLQTWSEAADRVFVVAGTLIGRDRQARSMERLEVLEATDELSDSSAAQIRSMKEELARSFSAARSAYAALRAMREELGEAIAGSLVILEDGSPRSRRVAVAHSALVGEHVYVPTGWNRTMLLAASGVLVGIMLAAFRRGTAIVLVPGAVAAAVASGGALYVFTNIWLAPTSVALVAFGAAGVVVAGAGRSHHRTQDVLTGRATERVPRRLLKRSTLRGGLPEGILGRRQAVIVVVAPDVKVEGDAVVLDSFHRAISRAITTSGGVVFGEEGLHVFAAFDAPPWGDQKRRSRSVSTVVQELVGETLPVGT